MNVKKNEKVTVMVTDVKRKYQYCRLAEFVNLYKAAVWLMNYSWPSAVIDGYVSGSDCPEAAAAFEKVMAENGRCKDGWWRVPKDLHFKDISPKAVHVGKTVTEVFHDLVEDQSCRMDVTGLKIAEFCVKNGIFNEDELDESCTFDGLLTAAQNGEDVIEYLGNPDSDIRYMVLHLLELLTGVRVSL